MILREIENEKEKADPDKFWNSLAHPNSGLCRLFGSWRFYKLDPRRYAYHCLLHGNETCSTSRNTILYGGSVIQFRLIKSYVCDSDDIMIDDEKCSIITVKVLY